MTVKLTTTIQKFIGLSTDIKPASPPIGSTFEELDTQHTYIYDGIAWVTSISVPVETLKERLGLAEAFDEINDKLKEIGEILQDRL